MKDNQQESARKSFCGRYGLVAVLLLTLTVACVVFTMPEFLAASGTPGNLVMRHRVDFVGYYLSSKMLMRGDPLIYDVAHVNKFAGTLGFPPGPNYGGLNNYPPSFYMLMIPMALPGYAGALRLWYFLNLIQLLGTGVFIYLAWHRVDAKRAEGNWFFVPVFFIASMFFSPTIDALAFGQTGMLVGLLGAMAIYLFVSGRKNLAGLCLGLAGALKVLPLFFLLYFIWKKEWKVVIGAMITFLILLMIPGFIWGFGLHRDYFSLHSRVPIDMSIIWNMSLYSVIYSFFGLGNRLAIDAFYYGFVFAFMGGTLWVMRGYSDKHRQILSFGLVVLLFSVVTPYAHPHNHVTILFSFGLVFMYFLMYPPGDRTGTVCFYLLWFFYGVLACFCSGFVAIRFREIKTLFLGMKLPYFAILAAWIAYMPLIAPENTCRQVKDESC